MSNLSALAQQYSIRSEKPFFPVNSLRLLYFIISDHYAQNSIEAREKITSLIPAVEAVLDARTQHRSSVTAASPQSDLDAAQTALEEVYALLDTPAVRSIFAQLFTYIYPLQDEIFLNLYQTMVAEQPASPQHLELLLHARSMDSVIFSTLVNQIILQIIPIVDSREQQNLQATLHHHIHLAYQMNDLVDAVVFAKDDLEAGSFSPFRLIQKITPEPEKAKELITTTLSNLQAKTKLFPFPTALQTQVDSFTQELIAVIQPGE